MKRRRVMAVVGGLLLAGFGFFLWNLDPERRLQVFGNQSASCANCRSHLAYELEGYVFETKSEWYPRGGKTPEDSLGKFILLSSPNPAHRHAHVFTSHNLAPQLVEYFNKHSTLNRDFMCYRYNEGLRPDDSGDLILMYYFKPTRWECHEHKGDVIGRPVMSAGGGRWDFIPEAEFQTRQKATEDLLRQRRQSSH